MTIFGKYSLGLVIIAAIMANTSCEESLPSGITGHIENTENKEIYLYQMTGFNKSELVSKAEVKEDKSFHFKSEDLKDSKDFYFISLNKKDNYSFVLDQGDNMYVHLDAEKIEQPTQIKGPKNLESYTELAAAQAVFSKEIAELNQKFVKSQDKEERSALQGEAIKIITEREDLAKSFIKDNKESALSLAAVQYLSLTNEDNLNLISEILKTNGDLSETMMHKTIKEQLIAEKTNINKRKTQEKKMLADKASHVSRMKNGIPEIEMENPQGELIKLSDLKGNVVLIDFWASWCGPCRRENPAVVAAYNKYNKDGFEIFSVSLDKNLTNWEAAIEKDGLVWPYHVSDLKGWQNRAAKAYGVSSVPHTVLIDAEGKLIDVKLRGAQLDQKLEEIFGY